MGERPHRREIAPEGPVGDQSDRHSDRRVHQVDARERTDSTGFVYLRARMCDPRTGRFLQRDTLARSGAGVSGWNRYVYYREYNPATVADPSGCCFWDVCIAEGAGVYLTAGAVAAAGYASWETGGKERTEDAAAKLGDALDAGWQAAAAQIPQWFPPRELLRDPRTGNAVPVLDDDGNPVMAPHTLVGTRRSRGGRGLATHPQAREFDENGKLLGDIDWTDHGRPYERGHVIPHQHEYDPDTGARLPAEPIPNAED